MLRILAVLTLIVAWQSNEADGARTVFIPLTHTKSYHDWRGSTGTESSQWFCTLVNPQPISQTVTLTVTFIDADAGVHNQVLGVNSETTVPAFTLTRNQSYIWSTSVSAPPAGKVAPKLIVISVNEDQGFLTGTCEHRYAHSAPNETTGRLNLPINGGRPF